MSNICFFLACVTCTCLVIESWCRNRRPHCSICAGSVRNLLFEHGHLHLVGRQHPSYGDCLEVKREYYQNSSVLDCVTQCSQSAAYLYEQFLQVNRLGLSHWDTYTVHTDGCLELYYCNMVEWFWWDSSLISTTNWFPSVLWCCWFGHLTCKHRPWNDLLYIEWDVKPYTLLLHWLLVKCLLRCTLQYCLVAFVHCISVMYVRASCLAVTVLSVCLLYTVCMPVCFAVCFACFCLYSILCVIWA